MMSPQHSRMAGQQYAPEEPFVAQHVLVRLLLLLNAYCFPPMAGIQIWLK